MSRFDASLLDRALRYVGKPEPVETHSPTVRAESAASIAAALCRRFEGFYSRPYLCPAGVWTIGYGATHYLDGRRVLPTDAPISRDAADRLLVRMIERQYMPAALRQCPNVSDPHKLAALVDFVFNVGEGALRSSTLRRRINSNEWAAVPGELRKWVRGGGRVLKGLIARREAEIALL